VYSNGVTDPHVASMAAPVFGAGQRLLGALAITGPSSRLTAEKSAQVAQQLLSLANGLTKSLGGEQ
jgi:DNA-binding IclR family transcriptional regulator